MTTVLIADDERSVRRVVRASLDGSAFAVVEATDGDEAWAAIEQHRPAIVLLDVKMPGRTGLELTRAIRDDPRFCGTRVVLLTARTQAADLTAGTSAGADCYVGKPFSPALLLQVVEDQSRAHRSTGERGSG